MTKKRYAEPGVAIPSTEAAIMTANGMSDIEIVMPDFPDNRDLPETVLFLVACAMRYYDDPAFVETQLAWLAPTRRGLTSRAKREPACPTVF